MYSTTLLVAVKGLNCIYNVRFFAGDNIGNLRDIH